MENYNEIDTTHSASSVGKTDFLKSDQALKQFLSREVKNSSPAFQDYAPTSALVDAAIDDVMQVLGFKSNRG